jgi:hypothetical protein
VMYGLQTCTCTARHVIYVFANLLALDSALFTCDTCWRINIITPMLYFNIHNPSTWSRNTSNRCKVLLECNVMSVCHTSNSVTTGLSGTWLANEVQHQQCMHGFTSYENTVARQTAASKAC